MSWALAQWGGGSMQAAMLPHTGLHLPGNGEFSFIPIIRAPGQTNSLIQMSPGATITFSSGAFALVLSF